MFASHKSKNHLACQTNLHIIYNIMFEWCVGRANRINCVRSQTVLPSTHMWNTLIYCSPSVWIIRKTRFAFFWQPMHVCNGAMNGRDMWICASSCSREDLKWIVALFIHSIELLLLQHAALVGVFERICAITRLYYNTYKREWWSRWRNPASHCRVCL